MAKGKVKIHGKLVHEIAMDKALETMKSEDLVSFTKRVESVYIEEMQFGIPNIDLLAYQVFADYYSPYVFLILEKLKNPGKIELDLFYGKSSTPKDQEYNDLMIIKSELDEHIRATYQEFENQHILKVKTVIDRLNLSQGNRFPINGVW